MIKSSIRSLLRPIWKRIKSRIDLQIDHKLSMLSKQETNKSDIVRMFTEDFLLFDDVYDTAIAKYMFNEMQAYSSDCLTEKFKILISNLDVQSISTVVCLLNRLRVVSESQDTVIDIFTKDEKCKIHELEEKFQKQIFKISNDLFFYNGYFLPINHLESSVFYYRCNLEHVFNIGYTKDKDIIDAGGFIGDSALIFSPLTNREVHVFEPALTNVKLMKKTLELNKVENVVIVPCGLGAESGQMELMVEAAGSTLGGKFNDEYVRQTWPKETVNIVTLDDYVFKNNLHVGLIKTDVEGFEQPLLAGAIETIKKQKPILLISIYHNISDFFDIKPMIERLNLGYKFKVVKPVDGRLIAETMLVAQVVES